jgi:hypothetical protein
MTLQGAVALARTGPNRTLVASKCHAVKWKAALGARRGTGWKRWDGSRREPAAQEPQGVYEARPAGGQETAGSICRADCGCSTRQLLMQPPLQALWPGTPSASSLPKATAKSCGSRAAVGAAGGITSALGREQVSATLALGCSFNAKDSASCVPSLPATKTSHPSILRSQPWAPGRCTPHLVELLVVLGVLLHDGLELGVGWDWGGGAQRMAGAGRGAPGGTVIQASSMQAMGARDSRPQAESAASTCWQPCIWQLCSWQPCSWQPYSWQLTLRSQTSAML